tara:strand:+ start:1023 stop:1793 length:771 start_codon:yes stop_codon:yes gene_type:complete
MSELRVYKKDSKQYELYREMHENQDLRYVKNKYLEYEELDNCEMSIKIALSLLDNFIDPSDPDLDVPNSIHAYQTAERIRKKYPDNKELQIVGLIHDLGKVLFSLDEPQWAVVGDTYVVGCEFPKSIVCYETLEKNRDYGKYDKNGIYEEGCGLDKLYITFGHDEYLYRVLQVNKDKHNISQESMDIIRYHSFYPWHSENEYFQFMKETDKKILKNVIDFNNFDLYSKEDDTDITDEVKKYYDNILDEYFNGELKW